MSSVAPNSRPVVLHPTDQVLSARHLVTWVVLAGAAGAVNAGGFMVTERFVSHVTGAVARLGLGAESEVLIECVTLLAAFVAGAGTSVGFLQARVLRGREPLHAQALWAVAGLVTGAGALGTWADLYDGWSTLDEVGLPLVLAFAMGLLNATVASSTALSVRTTHMTGPASDLGVSLVLALVSSGPTRQTALRTALVRGSTLVSFAAGAGLMVLGYASFESAAFLVPAALVLWAQQRSFPTGRTALVTPFHPLPETPHASPTTFSN